jgi:hypothetical protein
VTVIAMSGPGVVTRRVALAGASASGLVRDFNLLTVSTEGAHGCPALDGSSIGATMRAGGQTWQTSDIGCGGVSVTHNGKELPGLNEGAAFRQDLDRALGVPPAAGVVHRLAAVVTELEHANGKAYLARAAWAPDEATAVKTLTGDVVNGSSPVYVIQLQGQFTCTECSIPAGAKPPNGGVLVDVIDAHTFRSEDFSLTNTLVSLNEVGPEFSIPT